MKITKAVSISFTFQELAEIDKFCKQRSIERSEVVRRALKLYLKNQKKPYKPRFEKLPE